MNFMHAQMGPGSCHRRGLLELGITRIYDDTFDETWKLYGGNRAILLVGSGGEESGEVVIEAQLLIRFNILWIDVRHRYLASMLVQKMAQRAYSLVVVVEGFIWGIVAAALFAYLSTKTSALLIYIGGMYLFPTYFKFIVHYSLAVCSLETDREANMQDHGQRRERERCIWRYDGWAVLVMLV